MILRGRGGSGGVNVTTQRITLLDTIREIIIFTALYGVAGAMQLAIFGIVASLLGVVAGPAFLILALALEFSPRFLLDVRPLRIGLYLSHTWHGRERPAHIRGAQALLVLFGIIVIVVAAIGYFPVAWPIQIRGIELWSRWPWAEGWHPIGGSELAARIGLLLVLPLVGWSSSLLLQWAAKMEVLRPTFRESHFIPSRPDEIEGPMGERWRRAPDMQRGGDEQIILPPSY